MANRFYQPGDQRAERVNDLFARIARRYDVLNDLQSLGLHRLWKRRLVSLARLSPGASALDVCCGTGDITFALARAGACPQGLDFSEPMLQIARQRLQREAGNPTIIFRQGDAQQLPFPDHQFEAVTVGYGLRNLTSWETGLREMLRVAQPGGRVLVLDFGKPDNRLLRTLYFAYLRVAVPLLGLIFCGNAAAYAYILESLKHYPAQQGVDEALRRWGAVNTRIYPLLGGVMTINYAEKPPAGP